MAMKTTMTLIDLTLLPLNVELPLYAQFTSRPGWHRVGVLVRSADGVHADLDDDHAGLEPILHNYVFGRPLSHVRHTRFWLLSGLQGVVPLTALQSAPSERATARA